MKNQRNRRLAGHEHKNLRLCKKDGLYPEKARLFQIVKLHNLENEKAKRKRLNK